MDHDDENVSYGIPGASNETKNLSDGDGFFGPKDVQDSRALKGMLKDYDRRAGIDNKTWLRQYARGPDAEGKYSVYWPNDAADGYAVDKDGRYLKKRATIPKGTFIDRFGREDDSAYFAPFGTPFAARALPAHLLFQPYNAYEVVRELEADQGPIAPGFGQPGMGTQYVIPAKLGDSGKSVKQTPEVLKGTYLKRLTTAEIERLYAELCPENITGEL